MTQISSSGIEILAERMVALDAYNAQDIKWDAVWAVLAKAQCASTLQWANDLFWRLKLWSWVSEITMERSTCQTCGRRNESEHGRTRYCSAACRKVAHRCRASGKLTPVQALAGRAAGELRIVKKEIDESVRWLRRRRAISKTLNIVPPDLLQVRNLPVLPQRCGECAKGIGCGHTGGICLFATTTRGDEL